MLPKVLKKNYVKTIIKLKEGFVKFQLLILITLSLIGAAQAAVEADNSAINQREQRNGYALTADKHGISDQDIKISSEIRKALVGDNSLSLYAQNVKIITVNGEVTLKGPVKTSTEKKALANKAKNVAGVLKVLNRTEVVTE